MEVASVTVLEAYKLAIKVLKELPDKAFVSKQGKRVTIHEAADTINTVARWCYPELTTDDIQKVVRCEKCTYYHRYRKKGALKSSIVYLCSRDKKKRYPDFYCKDGVERE